MVNVHPARIELHALSVDFPAMAARVCRDWPE
jgi:hypothetical protein